MPAFSYCVMTKLSRFRVWCLLTDITNWPKFSDMYSDLHWDETYVGGRKCKVSRSSC